MSSTNKRENDGSESERGEAGGLGEILPEPLQPLWRPIERIQGFRHTYGDTYVTILEAAVAVTLIGGYLWWLYLFFVM